MNIKITVLWVVFLCYRSSLPTLQRRQLISGLGRVWFIRNGGINVRVLSDDMSHSPEYRGSMCHIGQVKTIVA